MSARARRNNRRAIERLAKTPEGRDYRRSILKAARQARAAEPVSEVTDSDAGYLIVIDESRAVDGLLALLAGAGLGVLVLFALWALGRWPVAGP